MARERNGAAQTLKLFGLLIICYGHIFAIALHGQPPGLIMSKWWVLGDICLFYFSMSSAYFTALHYQSPASMQAYWSRKVRRIGFLFLFISAILLIWFLIQGRDHVFSLLTLANLLGLNGFLNWFHIKNTSPLGAGQWFITALFLFYAVYPLMNRYCSSGRRAGILLWTSAAAAMLGEYFLHYGHSLWSTLFGFAAGFYLCRHRPSLRVSLFFLFAGLLGLAVLRFLAGASSVVSYTFIALCGYILCALTLPKETPWLACNFLRPLDGVFLPLFLMHMYFFHYDFTPSVPVNAILTLILNVLLAKLVISLYTALSKKFAAAASGASGP